MMTSLHSYLFLLHFSDCLYIFYFHPISPSSSHIGKSPSCDSSSTRSVIGGNGSSILSDNSNGDGNLIIGAAASETLQKQIVKASEIMTFQQKLLDLVTESMTKQGKLYNLFQEKVHNVNFVDDKNFPKFLPKDSRAPFGDVLRTTGKVRKRN